MTTPYPRNRTDQTSLITIQDTLLRRSLRNESYSFDTESAARAFRPSWFENPWGPSPPLTAGYLAGKSMQDMVVPGARKLIASGVVIQTNPLESVDRQYNSLLASYKTVTRHVQQNGAKWWAQWLVGEYFARPDFSDPPFPQHDLNRLTAARADMRSGYMDLLTSLVEFRKTVEMIVKFRERFLNELDKLVTAWAKVQKRPFRSYAAAMESLSSFWLEWRFGWRILWYDYLGILDILRDLEGSELRKPFRSRESSETSVGKSQGVALSVFEGQIYLNRLTTTEITKSGGCLGTGRYSGVMFDPVTTAWELLPLSLVLDMFWNVGDWLSANSPFAQVSEIDAWTSVSYSRTEMLYWTHVPPTNSRYEVMKVSEKVGTSAVYFRNSRRRQTHNNTPIYPEINLSLGKLLDLGAIALILRSLVTKRVRILTNRG